MQLQQLRIESGDRRRERGIAGIDRQQHLAHPVPGAPGQHRGHLQGNMSGAFVEKDKASHIRAASQRRVESILVRQAADFDYDAHESGTGTDRGDM